MKVRLFIAFQKLMLYLSHIYNWSHGIVFKVALSFQRLTTSKLFQTGFGMKAAVTYNFVTQEMPSIKGNFILCLIDNR